MFDNIKNYLQKNFKLKVSYEVFQALHTKDQIMDYNTEILNALKDTFKLKFTIDLTELYLILNHLLEKGLLKEKDGKADLTSILKDYNKEDYFAKILEKFVKQFKLFYELDSSGNV